MGGADPLRGTKNDDISNSEGEEEGHPRPLIVRSATDGESSRSISDRSLAQGALAVSQDCTASQYYCYGSGSRHQLSSLSARGARGVDGGHLYPRRPAPTTSLSKFVPELLRVRALCRQTLRDAGAGVE